MTRLEQLISQVLVRYLDENRSDLMDMAIDKLWPRFEALLKSGEVNLGALLSGQLSGLGLEAGPEPEPGLSPPPDPDPLPMLDDLDMSLVTFQGGPNISGWPITYDLEVHVDHKFIHLHTDLPKRLPAVPFQDSLTVGNPWVIARWNGAWRAATWEWLAVGQTVKLKDGIERLGNYSHQGLSGWYPQPGMTVYIAVAGCSRGGVSNKQERTPFRKVVWR